LLDEALVDFKELLLLALTLTLGLSARSSNKVFFLVLGDGFGVCPFLVLLAALIWLAGLRNSGTKCGLLLCELSKVISIRDAIVLWLGFSSGLSIDSTLAVTNQRVLLIGLGNCVTSLLVV